MDERPEKTQGIARGCVDAMTGTTVIEVTEFDGVGAPCRTRFEITQLDPPTMARLANDLIDAVAPVLKKYNSLAGGL